MKLTKDFIDEIAEHPCVFVHRGDNGRKGSILVFDHVDNAEHIVFKEVYCASKGKLYDYTISKTSRYSIRNLEKMFLNFNGGRFEEEYHKPVLFYCPINSLITRDIDDPSHNDVFLGKIKTHAHKLFCLWLDNHPQRKKQTNTQEGKKTMSINLRTAAAIVDETVTTIDVSLSNRVDVMPEKYSYLCKQELAQTLSEDDWVLVESGGSTVAKVGRVVAIHVEPNVELNADINYKWAFQKVELPILEELKSTHDKLHQMLKDRQRVTTRQSVMASLGITQDDLLRLK